MKENSLISVLQKINSNSESDECYTPNVALDPLLKYINKKHTIYEATSGISLKIVNYLKHKGYKVIASEGRDYLKDTLPEYDIMITNPPYSIKDKFIEKSYEIGKPFALLLPVASIQGIKRNKLFNKYGIDLIVLNKRIDFTGKGSPHFGVAWFTWKILDKTHNDNVIIFEEV